ncbi:hypothetical protein PaeBR_06235 [Paenibacillus sp. BR2-3]|uniref:hypothetical protein n=1 Tax=Paenibacillus sp. BR2-3 TaxID=3048494 RepID=UPI00397784A4
MICFAILAHQDEYALFQQIRNIRKYTRQDALIVLYNGGTDPNFGKRVCRNEKVMYCPYSRPLQPPRNTGRFFYDVMSWLEESSVHYEYLVFMEFDVMFVNPGFEAFLEKNMAGYDCIGKYIRHETDPRKTVWKPGVTMWQEWGKWQPFFKRKGFYGTFNPMQVYRHRIIKRMLKGINKRQLERLFKNSNVYALGEMLYLTLAMKYGGKSRPYPLGRVKYLRFAPHISLYDAMQAKSQPKIMFVHPVKDANVRNWISEQ